MYIFYHCPIHLICCVYILIFLIYTQDNIFCLVVCWSSPSSDTGAWAPWCYFGHNKHLGLGRDHPSLLAFLNFHQQIAHADCISQLLNIKVHLIVFLGHPEFNPDFAPCESSVQAQGWGPGWCYYSNNVHYYWMDLSRQKPPCRPSLYEAMRTSKSTNDEAGRGSS